jgi:hypothetical protein
MPYATSPRCKICQSTHRLEIEQLRVKEQKTFAAISSILNEKYGFKISDGSVHRHFTNHFEFISEEKALVAQESRKLYNDAMQTAGNRAAKLSGMVSASYKYVTEHFDELEMKTALQMLFGSIDQLNKMEGTGAFAGNDFLMEFQHLLQRIRKGETVQPTLIFNANELGEATEITDSDKIVDEVVDNLPTDLLK